MGPILLCTILFTAPDVVSAQQALVFEAEDVSGPSGRLGGGCSDRRQVEPVEHRRGRRQEVVGRRGPSVAGGQTGLRASRGWLPGAPRGADRHPPGSYEVTIKYGRGLAVSIDGDEWQRLSDLGGRLGRFEIEDGTLEFWVDDRFAQADSPGSCYFDTLTLTPILAGVNGIVNGGFEMGDDIADSGWVWWSREDAGSARIVPEGRDASRCARIEHSGERDWALTNPGRLAVEPGRILTATAWLEGEDTADLSLCFVAYGQGKSADLVHGRRRPVGDSGLDRGQGHRRRAARLRRGPGKADGPWHDARVGR